MLIVNELRLQNSLLMPGGEEIYDIALNRCGFLCWCADV